jgi:predicted nucleic acid-binding protein
MRAVDSSVLVPAFQPEFPDHAAAYAVVAAKPSLPAHAALETYAALTRMPAPHRVDPAAASELIARNFPKRILPSPSPASIAGWLREMAARGVTGGAVYDALIAETARAAGATLVTADRRAADTYRAVGVDVEMLGD